MLTRPLPMLFDIATFRATILLRAGALTLLVSGPLWFFGPAFSSLIDGSEDWLLVVLTMGASGVIRRRVDVAWVRSPPREGCGDHIPPTCSQVKVRRDRLLEGHSFPSYASPYPN